MKGRKWILFFICITLLWIWFHSEMEKIPFSKGLHDTLQQMLASIWELVAQPTVLVFLSVTFLLYFNKEMLLNLVSSRDTELKFGSASLRLQMTEALKEKQEVINLPKGSTANHEPASKDNFAQMYLERLPKEYKSLMLRLDIPGQTFDQLSDVFVDYLKEKNSKYSTVSDSNFPVISIDFLMAFVSLVPKEVGRLTKTGDDENKTWRFTLVPGIREIIEKDY